MLERIEKLMNRMGIDVFGVSDCRSAVPTRLAHVPFAITLGIRLSDAVIEGISGGPTKMYFHHYRSVNAMLDACALRCVIELQRHGHSALAIPASQTTGTAGISGDFQHKTAANFAGLGFMGKSGLFIHKSFGPRVRYATVMTDMPLEGDGPMPSQCGDCSACVSACPCGAIVGSEWSPGAKRDDIVDAALCSRNMKDKYQMIGRGSVCGICIAVCPRAKMRKTE